MSGTNDAGDWVRCPACLAAGDPLRLVVENRYRLVRCTQCRSEYFRPDPALQADANDAVSHYWEEYKFNVYGDPSVQAEFERRYGRMLARAKAHSDNLHSVLDVGCGIGNFLDFAEQEGLDAYGVDLEAEAVEAARQRGLKAEISDRLGVFLPDASVDVLTLWDVIEHLYDPEPVLRMALAKLRRPGGVVLLETPDARFWMRPLVQAVRAVSRGHLDLSDYFYYWEHKIYFSEAGLRAILARSGCEIVEVERLTSPREKMSRIFQRDAGTTWMNRALAVLWPLLERTSSVLGRGNKLMVVAVFEQTGAEIGRIPRGASGAA